MRRRLMIAITLFGCTLLACNFGSAAATATPSMASPAPPTLASSPTVPLLPTLPPLLPPTTPPPTATAAPSRTPGVTITVYFLDSQRFAAGTPPYEAAVTRQIPQTVAVARAVLNAYFAGPTPAETALGLVALTHGASGWSNLSIVDGIARVQLVGDCQTQGAAYNIGALLYANLIQFDSIDYVKIYDPQGNTAEPDGAVNSIPACLEP